MKRHVFLIYFLLSIKLFSQVTDDFNDGDFSINPQWTGNGNLFIINNSNQLQLNDTEENTAYLVTSNNLISDTEWRFWIKQSFSPSSNNNSRFYLTSDKQDLSLPLNGYFLQFGESGSNDAVELFRQTGSDVSSIMRSEDGIISSSFEMGVRIIHFHNGKWELYLDRSGGENFKLAAEGNDTLFNSSAYLGFLCKYTKSNSTKFYLDDVFCGAIQVDTIPPAVTELSVTSDSTLLLVFSEYLNNSVALGKSNYIVNNGVGIPDSVIIDKENPISVILLFKNKFELEMEYELEVLGLTDLNDNIMLKQVLSFFYYTPQPYDIIINEIMADPSPPTGLPEAEYIELLNTTQMTMNLSNWILKIGNSEKQFSNVEIPGEGYLIVGKDEFSANFSGFGEYYGFGSFSLTNSGQTIKLYDDKLELIHTITYDDSWYGDAVKELGGWSLEQLNFENYCSGSENWKASENEDGGTPGSMNSVANDMVLIPKIVNVEIISDSVVRVIYNQNMEINSMVQAEYYSINQGIGNPTNLVSGKESTIDLFFSKNLKKGIIYEVFISKEVTNCIGIPLLSDTIIQLGLPEEPLYHDVVINEILFNPLTNGEDYVEIYNRSDKIIDLKQLILGSLKVDFPNPVDTTVARISFSQRLLLPGSYALLTSSVVAVLDQYFSQNHKAFLEMELFPAYNNDKGHVVLMDRNMIIIDTFSYSEDLHFPLLVYHDGVALERINPDAFLNDNSNWHSASESVGFGTPGYQNSQYNSNTNDFTNITISPELFTPDNNGIDDIQNINYLFDKPGNVVSVSIYNSDGYLIKELVSNEYVGTKGSFSWDGSNEYNSISTSGIYIYLITVFNADGSASRVKKTGVLAVKY